MMYRPHWPLAVVLAVCAAGLGGLSNSNPVAACSGALVTFDEINAEATRIVVGSVRAIQGDPSAPDGLAITVEAVVRGVSPPEIFLLPPTFAGCDGRISEPIGARLVIATGPQYFDANPPEDLHPYWLLGPGDSLQPAGVEDPDARHRTLGDLVVALDGAVVPVPTANPADTLAEPAVGDDAGLPIAAIAAIVAGAAVLVFGLVYLAARRRPF